MRTYIPPLDQEHHQKELKEDIAIPYSHYGSHRKDQAEDSKWSYHGAKRLSHWCPYRDLSKAHITRLRTSIPQIPRDDVKEGGDMKEEIERFTSTLEGSAQPSS